jgi:hypothetical protein
MTDRNALLLVWLAALVVPYLVLLAANDFRSTKATLLRAAIAIGSGWILTIAYLAVAQAMVVANATPEELFAFYNRDGAPVAFASVFGWIPAAVIIAIAWPLHAWLARRPLRGGTKKGDQR